MGPEWGLPESYTGVGIGKEPEVDAIIGPEHVYLKSGSITERPRELTSWFLYTQKTQLTLGEKPERLEAGITLSTGRGGPLVEPPEPCLVQYLEEPIQRY